jgi:hypothetical protein
MQTQRQGGLHQSALRFTLGIAILIGLTLPVHPIAGQSTDPFTPTPMPGDSVKGRWPLGKQISHYYSIVAGPGVVKVMFNCVDDSGSTIVGQEVSDADNHLLTRLESIGKDNEPPTYVTGVAEGAGIRLVSTYELKRRQKLIIRFYTTITTPDTGGTYTIKVAGDGVTANDSVASTANGSSGNSSGSAFALPKTGKLQLVMDDGTIQEINLSRVREARVKP